MKNMPQKNTPQPHTIKKLFLHPYKLVQRITLSQTLILHFLSHEKSKSSFPKQYFLSLKVRSSECVIEYEIEQVPFHLSVAFSYQSMMTLQKFSQPTLFIYFP